MHLTLLEHGIYRQLLDWYYLEESSIPRETKEVFRRLLIRTEEEEKTAISILKEFFRETKNGWIHSRCDEEIAIFKGKSERAKENGKRGGRPKKPRETKVVISGLGFGSDLETQKKANSLTQELINSNTPVVPTGDEREELALKRARALFKMRESTPLDKAQARAWRDAKHIVIETTEEEWAALEAVYSSTDEEVSKYRKQSLATLLNNWSGSVTKALAEMPQEETPWKFVN